MSPPRAPASARSIRRERPRPALERALPSARRAQPPGVSPARELRTRSCAAGHLPGPRVFLQLRAWGAAAFSRLCFWLCRGALCARQGVGMCSSLIIESNWLSSARYCARRREGGEGLFIDSSVRHRPCSPAIHSKIVKAGVPASVYNRNKLVQALRSS